MEDNPIRFFEIIPEYATEEQSERFRKDQSGCEVAWCGIRASSCLSEELGSEMQLLMPWASGEGGDASLSCSAQRVSRWVGRREAQEIKDDRTQQ